MQRVQQQQQRQQQSLGQLHAQQLQDAQHLVRTAFALPLDVDLFRVLACA